MQKDKMTLKVDMNRVIRYKQGIDKFEYLFVEDPENERVKCFCDYYKLSCLKMHSTHKIFLATTQSVEKRLASTSIYLDEVEFIHMRNDVGTWIASAESEENLADAIKKSTSILVYSLEKNKRSTLVKNIFFGCKTLEDMLITKDLHSDNEI